jgi:hypothetical protein
MRKSFQVQFTTRWAMLRNLSRFNLIVLIALLLNACASPTPAPTSTATAVPVPTETATATSTFTSTPQPTATSTSTATPSQTPTATATQTPTRMPKPTATFGPSSTSRPTATKTSESTSWGGVWYDEGGQWKCSPCAYNPSYFNSPNLEQVLVWIIDRSTGKATQIPIASKTLKDVETEISNHLGYSVVGTALFQADRFGNPQTNGYFSGQSIWVYLRN